MYFLCPVPHFLSGLVEHLWREDWFFGHQFLNGANPTLIRRCTEIPSNLAVSEETVAASLGGGASLTQEMEVIEGNERKPARGHYANIFSYFCIKFHFHQLQSMIDF